MSTVHVTLSSIGNKAQTGTTMPVVNSISSGADTLTSSASSAQSSLTGEVGQFWSVTVTGGNVWGKFGTDPTAASDHGHLLIDSTTRDFAVTVAGEKLAIKDA